MNGIRKPNFITQSYLIKPSRFATNLPAGKKMSTKKRKLKPQIIMSEGHIPFEIQEEIIKRLPVKSLIRFTSVSKTWKSLIHSSKFIADHSLIQPQNLLVSYYDKKSYKEKYVSIADDETFPQHKSSLPIPLSVSKLERPRSMIGNPCIVGGSHGLICCYGYHNDHHRTINKETVVIWNPSIRRSVDPIVVPYRKGMCLNTFVGFWVCPRTFDHKLVKITCRFSVWGHIKATIPWQVEVFTLSSRVWRSPLCGTNNLPRTSIIFTDKQVVVDGIMYWLAYDKTAMHDELCNLIIPFDLTSEEFGEVYLPDSLATGNYHALSVSKLNESLVVLKMIYKDHRMRVCDVWMMMKDHVPKSFTKLYTINAPHFPASLSVLGFRKNGEPITKKGGYKLSTEHINDLGIDGAHGSIFVNIYTETLLLLNKSKYIIRC